MVGIFKNKNPGNAFLLLLYGLVLKFPLFLHPKRPVPDESNNYVYKLVLELIDTLSITDPIFFSFLAFLLLFTQASLLNRILNSLKLLPRSNYLVGMSFLLITSFVKEWNAFSAPMLINSLLIWIWYRMVGLYNSNNPKTAIYNVAVLVGLLPLIYSPSVAFALMLILALIINRPFQIAEYVVALLGIVTPYYFLFVTLYLTDHWQLSRVFPYLVFHIPRLPLSISVTAGLTLLLVPFLAGGYYVQANMGKMLIQVRKAWAMLLWYLVIAVLIIFINPANSHMHWMLIVPPVAAFHAAAYFYLPSRWLAALIHWLSFAFAIITGYGLV